MRLIGSKRLPQIRPSAWDGTAEIKMRDTQSVEGRHDSTNIFDAELNQFLHEGPPALFCRRWLAPVLACGLPNVAGAAKGLEIVSVPRVAASVERGHVVALKPTGPPTHDAAPPVTLEDGTADGGPVAGIQRDVVAAHVFFCDGGFPTRSLGMQFRELIPIISLHCPKAGLMLAA